MRLHQRNLSYLSYITIYLNRQQKTEKKNNRERTGMLCYKQSALACVLMLHKGWHDLQWCWQTH